MSAQVNLVAALAAGDDVYGAAVSRADSARLADLRLSGKADELSLAVRQPFPSARALLCRLLCLILKKRPACLLLEGAHACARPPPRRPDGGRLGHG
jgi:hypothetical protein